MSNTTDQRSITISLPAFKITIPVPRLSLATSLVKRFRASWIAAPIFVFLLTRLLAFSSAYIGEISIPGQNSDQFWHAAPDNLFLDVWARWDSGFYMRIVSNGYEYTKGTQSSVAFFPIYPLLMSAIRPFVGSELLAGVLVSNLSLLGALMFLYRLALFEFGDEPTARRTIFYISIFPTAFFFSAVYTESTFLLVSVATIYFARKRLWAWATLFGVLCAATRIIGALVWVVVIIEWMRANGWTLDAILNRESWASLLRGIRRDWPTILLITLIPLGMVSYSLFLKRTFNDPIAFWTAQAAWGRQASGPLTVLLDRLQKLLASNPLQGKIELLDMINLLAFFAGMFFAVLVWRRLGLSYAVYSVASLLIPASSGTGSLIRYVLVIFPIFMILAQFGRYQLINRAIIISFAVFLGILSTVFVNWMFVA